MKSSYFQVAASIYFNKQQKATESCTQLTSFLAKVIILVTLTSSNNQCPSWATKSCSFVLILKIQYLTFLPIYRDILVTHDVQ